MNLFESLTKLPDNAKTVLQTILLSLGAALGAVCFMSLVNILFNFLYVRASALPPYEFAALSFVFIMTTSLLVSLLMKNVPEAVGSGIPQVKAAYWKELGYMPLKTAVVKFIAGILSIGGGSSLGREGPTVFLGSTIASNLSGLTGTPKRLRRAAAAIGASAGLAAAFNTPLAAITFSIEEIINDLNTRYLGRVVLAALFGALTVHALVGRQPAFELPQVLPGSWLHWALIPLVALIASLLGIAFQTSSLYLRGRVRRQVIFPLWLAPCVGGFITWVVGCSVFFMTGKIGIFGLGYQDLSNSLLHGSIWWIAGILVVGKLIATVFSYSFGGCGGIFSPSLFIGGMSGAFIASLFGLWFPTTASDHVILATVGMSACLGAILRAPLTSTLIVFEMTHQFEIVPGLMISVVVSHVVARLTGVKHNFYDALLLQDGHELIKIKPPQNLQSYHNLPVSSIMNSKPITVNSTEPDQMRAVLASTPYRCFPYMRQGILAGIFTRTSMEKSLATGLEPTVIEARTTHKSTSVKEASQQFISSPHGFLIVTDDDATPMGILTLHDLLRVQASVSE